MTSVEKAIMETHEACGRIEERLNAHLDNPVIHQVPPCSFHKGAINRMWALLVLAMTALIASLTTGKG